jgi:hypothetical protein
VPKRGKKAHESPRGTRDGLIVPLGFAAVVDVTQGGEGKFLVEM